MEKSNIMKTVYVFLADGFEEVEALTPIDVLRRAGMQVITVSVMEDRIVKGAHGVPVLADALFAEVEPEADMLLLPGGMPGASNLDAHNGLGELIMEHAGQGKPLAAICAAPLVLGKRGLLAGKKATCYPGFENFLEGAEYTAAPVEQDGTVITGKGPGAAMDFAFAVVKMLCGEETVRNLKQGMMIKD